MAGMSHLYNSNGSSGFLCLVWLLRGMLLFWACSCSNSFINIFFWTQSFELQHATIVSYVVQQWQNLSDDGDRASGSN